MIFHRYFLYSTLVFIELIVALTGELWRKRYYVVSFYTYDDDAGVSKSWALTSKLYFNEAIDLKGGEFGENIGVLRKDD